MATPTTSRPTVAQVDAHVDARSSTALATARRNLSYLFNPTTATDAPTRLRTRAFLKSMRYIGIFIFWRVVRYAKYALAAAAVAAFSATAVGSVITGTAAVVAPTGIAASAGLGLVYAVGRWGFRIASQRLATAKQKVPVGAVGKERAGAPEPKFLSDTFA